MHFKKNKLTKLNLEIGSALSLSIVVIVLILVAFVSENFWHTRLDLTEEKQFTLSGAAVRTLEELPDLITIKCAMSSELPSQFVQVKTHVTDLLEEFKTRSNGKLELVYVDPGNDEEKRRQIQSLGIQEVQLQEQSSQGLEIKKGFFGLAITYGDQKEVIPVLNNLATFEYDLIVKIKKLTGNVKKVGIVEGLPGQKYTFHVPSENSQGEPPESPEPLVIGFDGNFRSFKAQLEKLYQVDRIDLSSQTSHSPHAIEEYDLLIVPAPKSLSEKEQFELDQYLMTGKSILMMTPGVDVQLSYGIRGTVLQQNYRPLLSHYGITLNKDVLVDDHLFRSVNFGNSFFPTPYPYWIVVTDNDLNREHPITSKIGEVSFPWTSSLTVDSTITILAQSSQWSWSEKNNTGAFDLVPKEGYLPIQPSEKPVAVLKTGHFTSYFRGKTVPDSISGGTEILIESQKNGAHTSNSRLLVIANAFFATDFYMQLSRDVSNLGFLLNAVDHLALDPDLIQIRSRNVASRPIPESAKQQRFGITLANLLIAPTLLIAIGVWVNVRRKRNV